MDPEACELELPSEPIKATTSSEFHVHVKDQDGKPVYVEGMKVHALFVSVCLLHHDTTSLQNTFLNMFAPFQSASSLSVVSSMLCAGGGEGSVAGEEGGTGGEGLCQRQNGGQGHGSEEANVQEAIQPH